MRTIPTINLVATGLKIKALMKENGYNVKTIAYLLGTSSQAVYRWLRGETLPTIDNMVFLAGLFSTTVDEILVLDYVRVTA